MRKKLFIVALISLLHISCSENTAEELANSTSAARNGAIQLSSEQLQRLQIKTYQVTRTQQDFPIVVPGVIAPAGNGIASVSTPIDGRIKRIRSRPGAYVNEGEVLIDIESLTFADLLASYQEEKAELEYSQKQLERIRGLVEKNISTQADLERIRAMHLRNLAAVRAAQSRLLALGMEADEVNDLANPESTNLFLRLRAPIRGQINTLLVKQGDAVDANSEILTIIDPMQIQVTGFIPSDEAKYVKTGDTLMVYKKTQAETVINTVIAGLSPALDAGHKAVSLFAPTRLSEATFRIGDQVRIVIRAKYSGEGMILPMAALFWSGEDAAVFIRTAENSFRLSKVGVEKLLENHVIIAAGVNVGDEVATSGIFDLKALMQYELFAE